MTIRAKRDGYGSVTIRAKRRWLRYRRLSHSLAGGQYLADCQICFGGNARLIHGIVWKDARPEGSIVIGEPLIPGCVVRSRAAYDRLFERIEKCKPPITLSICDGQCRQNQPISHWL